MQRQGSFAQAEYAGKKKQTRRDKFLAEMEQAVPPAFAGQALAPARWARLAPLYPKGERGRPPNFPLERFMLRVEFAVQQWYGLADEAVGRTHFLRQPSTARLCRDRA